MSDAASWRLAQQTRLLEQLFAEAGGRPGQDTPVEAARELASHLDQHSTLVAAAEGDAARLGVEAHAGFAETDTAQTQLDSAGQSARQAFDAVAAAVQADHDAEVVASELLGRLQHVRDSLGLLRDG